MIYDSHVHPDTDKFPDAYAGAEYLYKNFHKDVAGMLLIGLKELKCPNVDLAKVAKDPIMGKYFVCAGSLENFSREHVSEVFETYYKTGVFKVLKLHPRIQKFSMVDKDVLWAMEQFSKFQLPILVDCFHDGKQLLKEDPLKNLAYVAEKFPKMPVIVAHSGGFEIFRTLTFAKSFKNIFVDLSFSLLYYRESSLRQDFIYAIKCMRGERILFGTDYPDRDYGLSLKMSLDVVKNSDLSAEHLERFLAKNTMQLLGVNA